MPIIPNITKRKLLRGELALGFGVHHLNTVATPMLAASTGHDWLFIDTEHSALGIHEATQISIAALSAGVSPIVRVTKKALDEGSRALDNGAQGIVVPHVDRVSEAQDMVDAFRYPPQGKRSWGGPPFHYGFKATVSAEVQAEINRELLLVAMIEGPEGLENVDAIAAVDGVDVIMIGTSDLSSELGVPGQIDHPLIRAAYETIGAACRKHGKILGMGGVYDSVNAQRYIGGGARFVLTGSDHAYITAGAGARTETLRAAPLG